MMENNRVLLAREIAALMQERALSGPDSATVIGMAFGIFMEAEGFAPGFDEITQAVVKVAGITFDTLRAARERGPGNA